MRAAVSSLASATVLAATMSMSSAWPDEAGSMRGAERWLALTTSRPGVSIPLATVSSSQ